VGQIAVDDRGGVSLLTVHGEHDLSNEEVLRDGLATVLVSDSAVVVDLSKASFIDSSVLHTLAWASRPAGEAPGRAVVVCAQEHGHTRRLLHIAGLHEVVRVADTVEDALSSVAAEPA
jgi:anti-anti-sigma factor